MTEPTPSKYIPRDEVKREFAVLEEKLHQTIADFHQSITSQIDMLVNSYDGLVGEERRKSVKLEKKLDETLTGTSNKG